MNQQDPRIKALSEAIDTTLDACCEAGPDLVDLDLARVLGQLEDSLFGAQCALNDAVTAAKETP